MSTFHYTAMKSNGERFEGSVEVPDRFAVYDEVRKLGGTVLSVRGAGKEVSLERIITAADSLLSTVRMSEKITFTRNLAAMIGAGLALSRAVGVLERQTKNPKMKKVLSAVGEEIKSGNALHIGLGKFPHVFSPLMIAMVKAGEESGNLAETLRNVGIQMDRMYTLKKKVRGALIYPSIIITAMILVAVLMLIFVVPTLEATFAEFGVELPISTKVIIGASDFLVNNMFLSATVALSFVILFVTGLRTRRGKGYFDFLLLHIPIVSPIVKETNSARTARTLATLLASGVEVVSALSITEEVLQNSYYKSVLGEAREKVQKGKTLSSIFGAHEDIYPVLVGEMIAVGEETGKLSDMFGQLADFYEGEVTQRTKDLSTVIEPLLMIVVGIGVGFFAISMIAPIYSLSSSI